MIIEGQGKELTVMLLKFFWNMVERVMYICSVLFFHMCGKKLNNEQFLSLMQFVKFGIIGISNTMLSYLLYSCTLLMLKKFPIFVAIDYLMAQIIAFVISVFWSFYWNNRVVFVLEDGEKRSFWKALCKTYISYFFTGLLLNSILLVVWIRVLHISEFIAPIINLLITVPLNFIMNKLWAFK